ncbi:MAG: universal stress protein [Desulfobacterales bacterium]
MTDEHTRRSPIRRIMAALDASTSSLNALQTAVDLAARFDAELLGLFVEDINLLRLAQLPFAREVSFFSSRSRRIAPDEMELQLRTQAARIRNVLAQTADRLGVAWEFRTVRGDVGSEVLAAGADVDLVVIGKLGRSLPGMQRSGSTVRTLLLQRTGMTMILETRVQFIRTPVAAIYDNIKSARRTLDTAVQLAQLVDAPLIVFILAENTDKAENLKGHASEQLRELDIQVVFRLFIKPTLKQLAAGIRNETRGPVIIPCLDDWFEGEKLCGLVDEIANPVLLIR